MSLISHLKFDEKGLIPAITQDADSGEVLMLAWMNAEAVGKTVATGKAHYYSRSRRKLWMKGETSGHVQLVRDVRFDCDADCLLLTVDQEGAACHTGHKSCFYRSWRDEAVSSDEEKKLDAASVYVRQDVLGALYNVVQERKQAGSETSYVASLYRKGLDKILGKIGEEATELAVAGKGGDSDEIVYEAADLFFHAMVLLGYYDLPPERVLDELRRRFGLSGLEEKASRNEG
ncbi:MAG TPA: bifunctional phosphoribosyl-AMP cyclohydrolase/phosphoribosyl-ATP diphosphatase HisIE [Desulfuromonadales bacterium]|nr:bifunctional phosphoribosyl-AMP cyclohydrolase/phosphoribosyl-ATP diphosphatase HisIE [Desulfuromonadales bacterium]